MICIPLMNGVLVWQSLLLKNQFEAGVRALFVA
jgi:hypothetical protein